MAGLPDVAADPGHGQPEFPEHYAHAPASWGVTGPVKRTLPAGLWGRSFPRSTDKSVSHRQSAALNQLERAGRAVAFTSSRRAGPSLKHEAALRQ
jgi:hypothetical protein